MAEFKYKPYYAFNGASRADPFRDHLEKEEVERNLRLFFDEIGYYFEGGQCMIERDDDGVLSITTDLAEPECDERVKRCLNGLDLFATKIHGR
ncbi:MULTISPECIES: hypothetical protein [Stenotrophomonas]|uniref:Uncharacterized protein n=1 Tax=Stenotrophomonas lactitubi TaxID=2045214 RepID=A0AAW4GDZ8_9GAMM|nr:MULTISPECIES: hypothetical protein [Stenotrophomonas]MBM9912912.1 hypothetical protein [Stenotrophomonas lactitubi]MBM9922535.1 hypothetical protein [Stenotrophomonas lactitubi]MBM9937560.1 hypothetical protein [Stenotrophomonas lactitubi]